MRLVVNSQFFLDPESWEFLGNSVIPELLTSRRSLRFWTAGCSTGKEPYSLALLSSEAQPDLPVSILATDCNETALAAARGGGPYSDRDIENIPTTWRRKYFQDGGPPFFVRPEVRRKIKFASHDLLRDKFPIGFDLILYRDVETFFSASENFFIWNGFRGALETGGIVFVGATNRLPGALNGDFEQIRPSFYRRT